ncbi:MAG: F0F1 ATP synthase subunit delta [Halieaceae bacterium]|jgi:F-type H+-transporting ATPase subunit delta|nr:F0F1 ATP synthase subunit delta [Halieaceae bacterium]
MAELSTLARPYARAAFEYADGEQALDAWMTELQMLSAVVSDHSVRTLLGDPALTTDEQAEALIGLCGDELGGSRARFVRVLAENRRLGLCPQILEQFAQLKAQRDQSVNVEMISAFEVPDEVRDRVAAALSRRLDRQVVISTETDESLIGGVLIRAGDLLIDGSVRGRLNKLAEALTH